MREEKKGVKLPYFRTIIRDDRYTTPTGRKGLYQGPDVEPGPNVEPGPDVYGYEGGLPLYLKRTQIRYQ